MIKINDNYCITADATAYKLCSYSGKKDENGDDKLYIEGYFTTLERALKGFVKLELRKFISKKEKQTIQDVINKVNELNKLIESLSLDQ